MMSNEPNPLASFAKAAAMACIIPVLAGRLGRIEEAVAAHGTTLRRAPRRGETQAAKEARRIAEWQMLLAVREELEAPRRV